VDVLVCHYSEPSEDTVETLKACLALEYPPHLVHIIICDGARLILALPPDLTKTTGQGAGQRSAS